MSDYFNYSPEEIDLDKKKEEFNSAKAMGAFEKSSIERKESVKKGDTPPWFITQGYIFFQRKYSFNGETIRDAYNRIANTLSQYYTKDVELAREKFFNLLWKGHLAPSTPVLNNTGLGRGHSVSCSGGYVPDSVSGFYTSLREAAILSQQGYGTSGYMGDIRPRGATVSSGGTASGILPVFEDFITMANKISQGNNRRGQWAGYVPVMHDDFYEVWEYCYKNSTIANVGWTFRDEDISLLNNKDPEMINRWKHIVYLRSRFGKGYIYKVDAANRLTTLAIKNSGIPIVGSNLCSEIALPQNEEYSFSCVLSSLNLSKWDEFEEDTIFWATIFLDCVVEDTINQTASIPEIAPIHKFTKDFRALGLGTLGWHSYLQSKMISLDSLQAKILNKQIFAKINKEATKASQHLAKLNGEPLQCKGTGMANATLMAIAPNTSSALIAGGVSQGIEPVAANVFNQNTAAGEVTRMNPYLLEHLKEIGIYSEELLSDIAINFQGSIQHIPQISDEVKLVFRTAYEYNQRTLIDLAADRQPFICQTQSLNVFFKGDATEWEIADLTKYALLNPYIISLYYQRSTRIVRASNGQQTLTNIAATNTTMEECVACEG